MAIGTADEAAEAAYWRTKSGVMEAAAAGAGCLGRAAPDEPIFVLRAKDPAAAVIVRIWCQLAHQMTHHEADKIDDALEIAKAMDAWRNAHVAPYRWGHD